MPAPLAPPAIPALPVPAADPLGDFGDKLPPMLVKELRQGLRARTFVVVFLALQGLLGLVLLTASGAASSPQSAGKAISGIIFMFFSYAVLVIQPLRGIGALHREIQGNTIELMVMTRLSAWKIVLGKWVSLVSQSALLFAAIVPYLILRYWFGEMNLLGEVVLLLLIFVASAVATAFTVGLSALPSVIIRGLLPLVGGIILIIRIPNLCFGHEFDELVTRCSMQTSGDFLGVILTLLAAAYLAWTALGFGASMIAPIAENHATPRRLVTLGLMLLLVPVGAMTSIAMDSALLLVALITIPAVLLALTEPFHLLPPLARTFAKRGLPGRIAATFLHPGWPTGTFFTLLLALLALLFLSMSAPDSIREKEFFDQKELFHFLAVFGMFVMPAALMAPFHARIKSRFTIYFLLLFTASVIAVILAILSQAMPATGRGFLWFFSWIPPVGISILNQSHIFNPKLAAILVTTFTSLYTLILIVCSAIRLPALREMERESVKTPHAP